MAELPPIVPFSLTWALSSSVLIAVMLALRAALGRKMGPKLRYALWGLVLLRLLLPFEIGYSAFSVAEAVQKMKLPEASETVVAWRNITVSPDLSIPAPDPSLPAAEHRAQYETDRAERETQTAEARTVDATPVTVADVLSWVWYAGMAVTAAVFLGSNLRFYLRLRRRRAPLDVDCKLKVYSVENLSSSCLFGRSVYLSAETAEDEMKLRHVLAHELSHYRHGDHIWAVLRCAALAIHWYNPLVWRAAALSRQDSELFADAGALETLGAGEREAYGATLIALSVRCKNSASLLCTATTMTNGKKALRERITMIAKKPNTPVIAAVAIVIIAALAVCGTFMGSSFRSAVEKYGPVTLSEAQGGEFYPHEMVIVNTTADADLKARATVWDGGEKDIRTIYALYQAVGAERLPSKEVPEQRTFPIYEVTLYDDERNVSLVFSVSADGWFTRNGAFEREMSEDGPALFAAVDAAMGRWRSPSVYFDAEDALRRYEGETSDTDGSQNIVVPSDLPPVRVEMDLDDRFPQESVLWAQEMVWAAERTLSAAAPREGSEGYHVTDAKLTGLHLVNTGTAALDYAVNMYQVEWRIQVDHPEIVVLAGGMTMEDGWVTEQSSRGGQYIVLAVFDGQWVRLDRTTTQEIYAAYAGSEGQYDDNPFTAYCVRTLNAWLATRSVEGFTSNVPGFLAYIHTGSWDWGRAFQTDDAGAFSLIGALREYVETHELTDEEIFSLLRCTDGLDGAYAEAYETVLDAVFDRDARRYFNLWTELDEEHQSRAMPYALYPSDSSMYYRNAQGWMRDMISAMEYAVEAAREYARGLPEADTVTDWETPGVNLLSAERNIWTVAFPTAQDGILGPIVLLVEDGAVSGPLVRD